MILPSYPHDEEHRLQELHSLGILDTEEEALFDDLVKLGSYVTKCPISLISLIDSNRQWFKARTGLDATQTDRNISFCAHAIHEDKMFVVEDTLEDHRFFDNPLVSGDPNIRFYAGRPLVTKNGYRIGTLCAIDRIPRKLSAKELELLDGLARQAMFLIDQRNNKRVIEMVQRNSQTLFEKSPLLITSMKGPNHTFEYVNTRNSEVLNNTDPLGKSILDVLPEAQESGFLKILDHAYQTGETHIVKDSSFLVGNKCRYFDLVLTPRFGLDAQIDGVMGIIDDITDRKEMEIKLKKVNSRREVKFNKMTELLEQVPTCIGLLEGPYHRLVFANRMYRDLFLSDSDFEGKAISDLFPNAWDQGFIAILDQVYTTGQAYVGKESCVELMTSTGEKKPFYFNSLYEVTTNKDGKITGILAAIADMTEQVESRYEISSKVNELKSEKEIRERFVATLSHDLQNPLTAAKLGADRLKRKALNTVTVHKLADRIISNIGRTEGMVRNLLDANRIKAGQGLPISLIQCCLNTIVVEAVAGLTTISGRAISIEERSGIVNGFFDADGIGRVVENLVSNAIKYGDPRTPICVAISAGSEFVELFVHNKGPIIPKGDQSSLFDAYRRLSSAIESKQLGWGIGLALVKGIAQAHRGDVRVESEEGKGTTFIVKLPLGHAEKENFGGF